MFTCASDKISKQSIVAHSIVCNKVVLFTSAFKIVTYLYYVPKLLKWQRKETLTRFLTM